MIPNLRLHPLTLLFRSLDIFENTVNNYTIFKNDSNFICIRATENASRINLNWLFILYVPNFYNCLACNIFLLNLISQFHWNNFDFIFWLNSQLYICFTKSWRCASRQTTETYTGLTSGSSRNKDRFYEHTGNMNHQNNEGTSLDDFVWKLKDDGIPFKILWNILSKAASFNLPTKNATCV